MTLRLRERGVEPHQIEILLRRKFGGDDGWTILAPWKDWRFVFPVLKEASVQLWGSIIKQKKNVEIYRIHKWHAGLEITSVTFWFCLRSPMQDDLKK